METSTGPLSFLHPNHTNNITRREFVARELGEIVEGDDNSIDVVGLVRHLLEHSYDLIGVTIETGKRVHGHSMTPDGKVSGPVQLRKGKYALVKPADEYSYEGNDDISTYGVPVLSLDRNNKVVLFPPGIHIVRSIKVVDTDRRVLI